ncbi:MAG TPA: adenylate/guanylate cyclase domain-containing protein [Candidatus Methylomirabilis sp.]|nr:adenylate/guanylate cyclase domain-containing protein [Candidatus Methylomirabilis sp.]
MNCPRCQHDNPDAVRFCGACGARLEIVCPACRAGNPPGNKFCHQCGAPLGAAAPPADPAAPRAYTPRHLADKILASRAALAGERKQVSVLFVDVSGFTSLAARLDPEEVHTLMTRAFELMSAEVHRYEGTVNQFLGDGIMALFGAPIAHEDHARRAVHAALGIRAALAEYRADLQRGQGIDFQVRQGLNTGLVVVGSIGSDLRMDYTAVGDTTNVAARLLQAATPGQVVISESVHRAAAGYFDTEALGALALKGKREPVPAWLVLSPRGARTRLDVGAERGLTSFVGRERELQILEDCFRRAETGQGQVVLVVGEPGIGKSRLLRELQQRLGDRAGWLQGHCLSFGRSMAFHPLIDLLRRSFSIDETDSAPAIIEKIERGVAALGEEARAVAPYLRALLSVDPGDLAVATMNPEQRRGETLDALRRLLARSVAVRPQVVVIEDLHWVDAATEQFLSALADGAPGLRALLVFTYRPGYAQPFGERSFVTRIAPASLSARESARMAEEILRSSGLPPELTALIAVKAEGNPFFVEEVVRSLRETGAVQPADGGHVLVAPADQLQVPDTIQDLIAARIDRLADEPKRALQVASVIGREFTRRLFQRLTEIRAEADAALRELVVVELIREKALFPELVYTFTHALTHDVAYESLLVQRRRELHRLIGRAIEEVYTDRIAEHYEVLAYHFSRGEAWEPALDYLLRAARKTAAAFGIREALAFYDEALIVAGRLGAQVPMETMMAIHRGRADLLFGVGEYPAAREAAEHLLALARRAGDRKAEAMALVQSANAAQWMEDFDAALAQGQEAVAAGEASGDQLGIAGGLLVRGFVLSVRGDLDAGARETDRALAISRAIGNLPLQGEMTFISSFVPVWQSRFEEALALAREGLQIGRKHRLLVPLVRCLWTEGVARAGLGEYDAALRALEEGLDVAERVGAERFVNRYLNTLAWLRIDCGDLDAGLALGARALELARPSRHATGLERVAFIGANQGVAFLARGDLDAAADALEEAHHIVQHPPVSRWMTWRYGMHCFTTMGELALARGDLDAATGLAEQSLTIAVATRSRKYESRARRLAGEAAAACRRWDDAERALGDALAVAQAIGEPRQTWKTRVALARLDQARGRPDGAYRHYHAASELVERILAGVHEPGLRRGLEASAEIREIRAYTAAG